MHRLWSWLVFGLTLSAVQSSRSSSYHTQGGGGRSSSSSGHYSYQQKRQQQQQQQQQPSGNNRRITRSFSTQDEYENDDEYYDQTPVLEEEDRFPSQEHSYDYNGRDSSFWGRQRGDDDQRRTYSDQEEYFDYDWDDQQQYQTQDEEERILAALDDDLVNSATGDDDEDSTTTTTSSSMSLRELIQDDEFNLPEEDVMDQLGNDERRSYGSFSRHYLGTTRRNILTRTKTTSSSRRKKAATTKSTNTNNQDKSEQDATAPETRNGTASAGTIDKVSIPNAYVYQTPSYVEQQKQQHKQQGEASEQARNAHTTRDKSEVQKSLHTNAYSTQQQPQVRDERYQTSPQQHPPQAVQPKPSGQRMPYSNSPPIQQPGFPNLTQQQQQHQQPQSVSPQPSVPKKKPQRAATSSNNPENMVISPWVQHFLSRSYNNKHEKLMLVPIDFLLDPFNLAQLAPVVQNIVDTIRRISAGHHSSGSPQSPRPSSSSYPLYKKALRLITAAHYDPPTNRPSQEEEQQQQHDSHNQQQQQTVFPSEIQGHHPQISVKDNVEIAAIVLYCLVHQRYVLSPRGLEAMRRRFLLSSSAMTTSRSRNSDIDNPTVNPLFGRCPQPSCDGMPLLPAGHNDYYMSPASMAGFAPTTATRTSVSRDPSTFAHSFRYCGKCQQYWVHWPAASDSLLSSSSSSRTSLDESLGCFIQGCAWGLSLGPLFHLSFPGFLQPCGMSIPAPPREPRIFGFRIQPDE